MGSVVGHTTAVHGLAHHLICHPHHLSLSLSLSILLSAMATIAMATSTAEEDDGGGGGSNANIRPSVNFGRIVGFLVLHFLGVSLDYGPIWTFNNQIILSFIFCLCTDLYVLTPWEADTWWG